MLESSLLKIREAFSSRSWGNISSTSVPGFNFSSKQQFLYFFVRT